MKVEQQEDATSGEFFIRLNDKKLAKMTYSKAGEDRIIVDHTEVGDELRGQGAGYKMVEVAVNYAREKGISIVPLCPFARSVFDKRPEFGDVL